MMCCIVGTRVIEIPYNHIKIVRRPKRTTVYPMEIVEIQCPADREIIAVYA